MTNLKGKRILVTGGAGFLGQHIVSVLEREDCESIYVPRSEAWDLRDERIVRCLLACERPDIVIHAAAQAGGIGLNQARPGELFYNNAIMGINVTEECRRIGVEKLVVLGTVCEYPKFTPVPFKEETLWDGYPEETNAPYGIAKKALLVMGQAYRQQYGLSVIHLLPVNLYGPHDNFKEDSSHVIPALIRKFVEARERGKATVEIWGSGLATREFLYVEDAARAIVSATQYYDEAAPLNIGSGVSISIKRLAELISKYVGYEGRLLFDMNKPDGQPARNLDINKAYDKIGFQALTNLEEGLKATIYWYLKNRSAE